MVKYVFTETTTDIAQAKKLIVEYAESLGCSPCLHNIKQELSSFPHPFALPTGMLIIVMNDKQAAGVVGIKKINDTACEMARLYVRPQDRGNGLGKGLAKQALYSGRNLGYQSILLYTLPAMTTALSMYSSMGFQEIDPYTDHPVEGAIYMRLTLSHSPGHIF